MYLVYIKEYFLDMLFNVDSLYLIMKNIYVGSNGVYKLLKGKYLYKVVDLI